MVSTSHGIDRAPGVAVAGCLSGPADLGDWIASVLEPFPALMRGAAGFREYRLLEVVHGGAGCCYAWVGAWDRAADYARWRDAVGDPQVAARADPARSARLRPARAGLFPASPPAGLRAAILAMAAADLGAANGPAALRTVTWAGSGAGRERPATRAGALASGAHGAARRSSAR